MEAVLNKHLFSLVFIFTVFCSQAQAGGGLVDNGGGFAEIQMYALEQKIPSFLGLCLQTRNPCQLKTQDQKLIQNLLKDILSQNTSRIEIAQTCQSPTGLVAVNGTLFVEACALYQALPNGKVLPKNPDELFLLLLQFYAHAMQIEGANETFLQLSQNLRWLSQKTVAFQGNKYLLHQDVFQWLNQAMSLVALETQERTIDLSPLFQSQIQCRLSHIALSGVRVQTLENNEVLLLGKLHWSCASTTGIQDFTLHLAKDLSLIDLFLEQETDLEKLLLS